MIIGKGIVSCYFFESHDELIYIGNILVNNIILSRQKFAVDKQY